MGTDSGLCIAPEVDVAHFPFDFVGTGFFALSNYCLYMPGILVDKQLKNWYPNGNIYVEVVDLSKTKYPNRNALRDANDIYLDYMRPFVIHHLKQVPGENVENLIAEALDDRQADDFWRKLDEDNDIESAIDFSYFPLIIKENWLIKQNRRNYGFAQRFDGDMTVQSRLWLIREGRNACEHRPAKDLDPEFVRTHLFLIAEVLSKINRPDQQHEVETIRDKLDNTKERLAGAEERLKDMSAENTEYQKSFAEVKKNLETAESAKLKYEEDNATLSKQIDENTTKLDEKEKRLKKLSKQLKSARAENDKYKKNLAGTKQRLEKSEAAQTGYKERLETKSNELKDTKDELAAVEAEKTAHQECLETTSKELEEARTEWGASEARLTAVSNQLTVEQAEKSAFEARLVAMRQLFTTATIGNAVFPPFEIDAAARILDRRNTEKKNYLLNLLEQKQPTIIYVQSEEKIDELLTLVGPEKAKIIGKHNEQTSKTEEIKTLEKLENGELIAIVSNTTLPMLTSSHSIEHFVFCHLVPGLDTFFKRCQPAFTPEKNNYLHLIYNNEKDIDGLNQWLAQRYPDEETLRGAYRELKNLAKANSGFVKLEEVYNALDIVELEIETGLVIFEELGFLERNGKGIITLFLSPIPRELEESDTYRRGEELKKETAEFRAFQLEYSIEQIWGEILEKLNIESEQILRENSIHKIPSRISEYVSDTTEADRDEVAVKVVEMRINSSGSKMSWRSIREKLGLKHDQFHKVIRHSAGYRKAVIDRIKSLKAQEGGWEYSGKLEVLTGIEITEEELS